MVTTGVLLAGCSPPPPPDVAFFASGKTVTTGPAQYCDIKIQHCAADAHAQAVLTVPPGRSVQISVPVSVGNAPWQVVFRYRSANGEQIDGRSAVFTGGQQLAYTLQLPDASAQLETAEVQQFGAALVRQADGYGFLTRASWILSATGQ
jgi:hypothetical protein